jgi:hypothetical protein
MPITIQGKLSIAILTAGCKPNSPKNLKITAGTGPVIRNIELVYSSHRGGTMLIQITAFLDLFGMAVALWMAVYVLARGYHSPITRRAFIALLCLAMFFFGAYNNIFNQVPGTAAWRAVLLITALYFWYDLTNRLLPETLRRGTRIWSWLTLGLALSASILVLTVPNAFRGEIGNPLNIGRMEFELPFIAYGVYLVEVALAILNNHRLTRVAGTSRIHRYFYTASLIAAINVGHGVLSLAILEPQSRVIQDGLILASVIVLGYSVARHQTFVERRIPFMDFQASSLAVLSLAGLFGIAGLVLGYSPSEIGVIVGLAVLSLSSYDFVRLGIDSVLSRQESLVRRRLLQIAHDSAGSKIPAQAGIERGLHTLLQTIQTEVGLAAVPDNGGFRVIASHNSLPEGSLLPFEADLEGDLVQLSPEDAGGLSWLAPCIWQEAILALVAIGSRAARSYGESDLDLLAEFADHVALLRHLENLQSDQTSRLAQLAGDYQNSVLSLQTGSEQIVDNLSRPPAPDLVKSVEEALRKLADVSFLGRSPLADILNVPGQTHLERGQALRDRLLELLKVLRPAGDRPGEPLPRAWHSYAILYDAYVEDVPNREIMARLYISEGTFNRTRRKAIRALARSIREMEVGS